MRALLYTAIAACPMMFTLSGCAEDWDQPAGVQEREVRRPNLETDEPMAPGTATDGTTTAPGTGTGGTTP